MKRGVEVKTVANIVRWVIGIFVIGIGGLVAFTTDIAALLWVVAGLLMLPPITRKIPQFKGKAPVLIVGCMVLMLMGLILTPETESTEQPSRAIREQGTQDSLSQETPAQETPPQDTPTPEPEKPEVNPFDEEAAEELKRWISDSVTTTGSVNADEKDITKWSKISEQNFLPIWKSIVLEKLSSIEKFSYQASYLKGAADLYESLYGNSAEIADIEQLTADLSKSAAVNEELLKKYPFDLSTVYPAWGSFYITQRLETSYSDNILGKLQKEFDSYKPKSNSDWVAYDVEYILDTAWPRGTFRVVHADSVNPFNQSGAYDFYYVDTGTTTITVDSDGFQNTVPVYQLIENIGEVNADRDEYWNNYNRCQGYLKTLDNILRTGEPDGDQAPATVLSEVYTGDVNGCNMSPEQAQAFAALIEGESRQYPVVMAALFDGGNGIPLLWLAHGTDGTWDGNWEYGFSYRIENNYQDQIYTYTNGITEECPWMTKVLKTGTDGIMIQISLDRDSEFGTHFKMFRLNNGGISADPFATGAYDPVGNAVLNDQTVWTGDQFLDEIDLYRMVDAGIEDLLSATTGSSGMLVLSGAGIWIEGASMASALLDYAAALRESH